MSRGFGANFGSANGDAIQLAASAITTQHTLSVWFYCHSDGSGTTLGFLWSCAGFPEIYMNGANTTMSVSVPFTTTSGEVGPCTDSFCRPQT